MKYMSLRSALRRKIALIILTEVDVNRSERKAFAKDAEIEGKEFEYPLNKLHNLCFFLNSAISANLCGKNFYDKPLAISTKPPQNSSIKTSTVEKTISAFKLQLIHNPPNSFF